MARLHRNGCIAAPTVACLCLVMLELILKVNSFTPVWPLSRNDGRHTTIQRSAVSFGATDDSEWYSPPPAPKAAVVPRPFRSKPLQTDLTTAQDLSRILNDSDDRLIIIKYYASWCKSCAKVGLKMDQLASEHADWIADSTENGAASKAITKSGDVRIFNVEYGAARELCVEQGIHQLPTIHMYTMGRAFRHRVVRTKVQDFACPPRDFQRVRDLTKGYILQQEGVKKVTANDDEIDLEAKLSAGYDMIQATLLNEKAIALASSSESSTSSNGVVNDGKSMRVLPRLWRRFRP